MMNGANPMPGPDLRERVIERLVEQVAIGESALARARQLSLATGIPAEQALNRLGVVDDNQLAEAYSLIASLPLWSRGDGETELLEQGEALSAEYLKRHGLLPLRVVDGVVEVATQDPLNVEGVRGLSFALSQPVRLLVARVSDVRETLDTLYPHTRQAGEATASERTMRSEIDRVEDEALSSDAVSIVTRAVAAAIRRRASDIHFEPRRHDLAVRLRIDGQLVDHLSLDRAHAEAVAARVKVLANLDLGERRLPQDGRAGILFEGRNVDLRVSIVPSVYGETAVLRILDRNEMAGRLDTLGFSRSALDTLGRAANAPSGVFLVSGPTGSGKTTTLYAMLNLLKGRRQKILSVEDPVEYRFDHVVQVQAAPHIGLTFASALRSFLRQDPDVILVGEIRDAETAEVAFQAAMTGHLVLASIHANDAVRVVSRLRDLGAPGYQIASALIGASAQRLLRKLCLACRSERPLSPVEADWCRRRGHTLTSTSRGAGCIACDGEGYVGRTVINEQFELSPVFAEAIGRNATAVELEALAREQGHGDLAADGIARVRTGEIDLRDLIRVMGA